MSTEADIVEKVARIIDREAHEKYDDAHKRKDFYDKMAWIGRLTASRDRAREILGVTTDAALAIIDPWTRGAFTGWAGKTYRSRITLDRAEDHFTECMREMKDDVRAKLTGAPAVMATDGGTDA